MITKIRAAQRAARSGTHTLIVGGREAGALIRAANGDVIGTCLRAHQTPLAARKQWLADHLRIMGSVLLDDGAIQALRHGKSLLPVGVQTIQGEFDRGSVIACLDANGTEIARGLANYPSVDAKKIIGRASQDIESLLGYMDESELIHRDNLVLI
jgi:glutamate 5-kinase